MIEFGELAEGLNHPEGVAWDPVAACVLASGEGGELYRVTLDGAVDRVASTDGTMLGVAVDGDGQVLACGDGNGRVVRLDPARLAFEVIAEDLDTPNMLAFAPDGALYITCSGEEDDPCIVRVSPDGKVERWCEEVPGYPNGCLVTPDGRELVVVEAHAQRLVGVVRVALGGAVEPLVQDPLARTFDAPTNLCFVGPGLERAVVANVGDRFLSMGSVGVAGAPLHYPRSP